MAADGGSNEKDGKKRRLQLMPEVLPDPKKAEGTGSARQRTLKTMERLIAVSAASALIASADVVGGCGYGVVDPLPPPSNCPDFNASTIKATWKLDNNQFVVFIEFGAPTNMSDAYLDADPTVPAGGKLLSRTFMPDAVTVKVQPNSGAESVQVVVPVSCSSIGGDLTIFVQLVGFPMQDGASLPVSL